MTHLERIHSLQVSHSHQGSEIAAEEYQIRGHFEAIKAKVQPSGRSNLIGRRHVVHESSYQRVNWRLKRGQMHCYQEFGGICSTIGASTGSL